jgi:hypothetical protein
MEIARMSKDHDRESRGKNSQRPCHTGCKPRYQRCGGSDPARNQRPRRDSSHGWPRHRAPSAAESLFAERDTGLYSPPKR